MSNIHHWIKLLESYQDWNDGLWVHYTDHPMLMIAPKKFSFHQDPAGIYFFPEKFTHYSEMWRNRKYAFYITISPTATILDLSNITDEIIDQLLTMVGGNAKQDFDWHLKEYPPKNMAEKMHSAWDSIRRSNISIDNQLSPAGWNKKLRQAGYDAIFDDTGAIHSVEVQLLVLNPKIITSIKMVELKTKPFPNIQKITQDVAKLCEPYGKVEITPPKKIKNKWDSGYTIESRVHVENKNDKKYALFKIYWAPSDSFKHEIKINLIYSMPSLGYGVGATYNMNKNSYDRYSNLDEIKNNLDKIFNKE